MTVTEIRPADFESFEPRPVAAPEPPRPARAGWRAGTAVGLGIVALVISLVALSVALGRAGSGRAQVALGARGTAGNTAAGLPPTPAFGGTDLAVTLSEFKAGLEATTVTAGTRSVQITNGGTIQHELLVFHPDASISPVSLPLGPDGNVIEDAPGVNKVSDGDNIDPGHTQTRQIDLTQPGTYVFVCNLPGHYKLGMWSVVTVR